MTPECNLCGSKSFSDVKNRPLARCRSCGSYERTRLLWLYIEKILSQKINPRILHIAPELGVYNRISAVIEPDNYTIADFQPANYPFAPNCVPIDLTNLKDWPDRHFDIIIHSHVMEHIACNIAYTLFHLHRMLDENGKHICIIPFSAGGWDESFQLLPSKERTIRFGQSDHIRRFGTDDIYKHLGSVMRLPDSFDATRDFSEDILRNANIPETAWKSFSINSVLVFEKDDYLLTMT